MAHYDLFVIGGGSGGVACARRSAAYGASVGLAEGSRMGGTCVIRGCVPKKLMHYAGLFGDFVQTARSFGWKAGHPEHDFQALLRARNEEIARLNGIYVGMLEKAGVAIHAGRATLGPHRDGAFTIEVTTAGGPEHHSADRVVVAVGARPVMPDIEGIEHAVTSDFMLEEIYPLPRRFTVVGAGYIGLEIAGIMNGLGADTTLLLRGEEPLRGFDDDLRREITAGLERHGLTIRPKTVVRRIAKNADGAIVLDTDRGPVEADLLLYATGRKPIPQTENIGLEALGVEKTAVGMVS